MCILETVQGTFASPHKHSQPAIHHGPSAPRAEAAHLQEGAPSMEPGGPHSRVLVSGSPGITTPSQGRSILSVAPECFSSSAKHEFIQETEVLGTFVVANEQYFLICRTENPHIKTGPNCQRGVSNKQTYP